VIAVGPDASPADHRAIDRPRAPAGQSLETARKGAPVIGFDDEMNVIGLDGEVNDAKVGPIGARNGLPQPDEDRFATK